MSLSTQSLPSDLSRVPTAAADNNAMQRKAPNKKPKKNPYVNKPPFTLHINQDQQVVIPLDALSKVEAIKVAIAFVVLQ